jgi:hypothetical protein
VTGVVVLVRTSMQQPSNVAEKQRDERKVAAVLLAKHQASQPIDRNNKSGCELLIYHYQNSRPTPIQTTEFQGLSLTLHDRRKRLGAVHVECSDAKVKRLGVERKTFLGTI